MPEEDLAQYWERLDCCGRDGWIILHYPIASPLEPPFSCTFAEPFYPIVGCGQFTGGSCSWWYMVEDYRLKSCPRCGIECA